MAAMAATGNLPVAFAALLGGGLLLEHGVSTVKTAFAGGDSNSTLSTVTTGPAGVPAQHGLVKTSDLTSIGSAHGWGSSEIADWMKVIMAESNGTLTDTNPSSGAYGIAQFINGPSEYAQYGGSSTTLIGQLTAMANYIAQRYGTPSAAWAFHQANNWY